MLGNFCRACGGVVLTTGKCKKGCGPRYADREPYQEFCEKCGRSLPKDADGRVGPCPDCG